MASKLQGHYSQDPKSHSLEEIKDLLNRFHEGQRVSYGLDMSPREGVIFQIVLCADIVWDNGKDSVLTLAVIHPIVPNETESGKSLDKDA